MTRPLAVLLDARDVFFNDIHDTAGFLYGTYSRRFRYPTNFLVRECFSLLVEIRRDYISKSMVRTFWYQNFMDLVLNWGFTESICRHQCGLLARALFSATKGHMIQQVRAGADERPK